jgi:hypothetical protein
MILLLNVDRIPRHAACLALIEGVQLPHVLVRERKVVNGDVRHDPRSRGRLGERHKPISTNSAVCKTELQSGLTPSEWTTG